MGPKHTEPSPVTEVKTASPAVPKGEEVPVATKRGPEVALEEPSKVRVCDSSGLVVSSGTKGGEGAGESRVAGAGQFARAAIRTPASSFSAGSTPISIKH